MTWCSLSEQNIWKFPSPPPFGIPDTNSCHCCEKHLSLLISLESLMHYDSTTHHCCSQYEDSGMVNAPYSINQESYFGCNSKLRRFQDENGILNKKYFYYTMILAFMSMWLNGNFNSTSEATTSKAT